MKSEEDLYYEDDTGEPDVEDGIMERIKQNEFEAMLAVDKQLYEEATREPDVEDEIMEIEQYYFFVPEKRQPDVPFEKFRKMSIMEKVNAAEPALNDLDLKFKKKPITESKLDYLNADEKRLKLHEKENETTALLSDEEKFKLYDFLDIIAERLGLTEKQKNIAFWYYVWGITMKTSLAKYIGITPQGVANHLKAIQKKIEKRKINSDFLKK